MDIQQISDHLAIVDLVNRYSDAIVRRDAEAWSTTWAAAAEWHIFGRVVNGREAIVEQWKKFMNRLPFVHQQSTGGWIDVSTAGDDDIAHGRWYVTEYGMSGEGPGLLTLGHYYDDYVRDQGTWQFQRRRFGALYMGPPDLTGTPQPFPFEA